MPLVCARRLGYSYSDRVRLFDDVEFCLSPGWYGLVGANGTGKTTLARLIAGELRPTVGQIGVEPKDCSTVLCPQEVTLFSEDLRHFSESHERTACRLRGLLGLVPETLERWETLSPGERKRWQLGTALSRSPDVLIVDEPTNHLDADGRAYLIEALSQFPGVGIAISHDRELLGALTHATLRIHAGKVASFPGSYAEAQKLWEAAREETMERRAELLSRRQRLEQRLVATGNDRQAADRRRSAGSRMKNIHDHDGSSFAMTERARGGEASIGRRLRVMTGQLERLTERIPEVDVDKTLGRSVFLGYVPAPKPHILGLYGEDVASGNHLVLRDARVTLARDARVHLRGPNGAGKTTLLEALLRSASETAADHILYLPQELRPPMVEALRRDTLALPKTERGKLLSILSALGVDPEHVLGSSAWSPGESRKLKLAYGMARHAWALVLDEPTNHLDLASIERLETALRAYPGAILLVSHDATFAARCTNQAWEIRQGKVET